MEFDQSGSPAVHQIVANTCDSRRQLPESPSGARGGLECKLSQGCCKIDQPANERCNTTHIRPVLKRIGRAMQDAPQQGCSNCLELVDFLVESRIDVTALRTA